MYTPEEKKKAVQLYIQYNKQLRKTVRTLGYPSPNALRQRYADYKNGTEFKDTFSRKPKYNKEQKTNALNYYINHGKNISKTIAALGYASRCVLKTWISEK